MPKKEKEKNESKRGKRKLVKGGDGQIYLFSKYNLGESMTKCDPPPGMPWAEYTHVIPDETTAAVLKAILNPGSTKKKKSEFSDF